MIRAFATLNVLRNAPDNEEVHHREAQENKPEHSYLPLRSTSRRIPNHRAVALTCRTATP